MSRKVIKVKNEYLYQIVAEGFDDFIKVIRSPINIEVMTGKNNVLNFDGFHSKECQQGVSFVKTIQYQEKSGTAIDLSTVTAIMQVRTSYDKSLIVELSTTNGKITFDSNDAMVLSLTPEETSLLPVGKYVYDIEITWLSGLVERFVSGEFLVTAEVSL